MIQQATPDPVRFHLEQVRLDRCRVRLDRCSSSQRPAPAPVFKIRFQLGFPFFIQHLSQNIYSMHMSIKQMRNGLLAEHRLDQAWQSRMFFIQHTASYYIVLHCIIISMYVTLCEVVLHCTSKLYRKNFQIGSVEKLDCISLLHATHTSSYYIVLFCIMISANITLCLAVLHCTS